MNHPDGFPKAPPGHFWRVTPDGKRVTVELRREVGPLFSRRVAERNGWSYLPDPWLGHKLATQILEAR